MMLYPRPAILQSIDPERHAVIEASAGTGKTFTLEHLIVDVLLRNPELKIENILVVTFTERATAELKVRVRTLLTTMIQATRGLEDVEDDPTVPMYGSQMEVDPEFWAITPADRSRLERALFSFDIAPIYTIHGFCQRILTEYAFANERFYDQHHIDFPLLFDRAFTDAMRRTLSCHDETRDWLEAWLETSTVEELKTLLSRCMMMQCEIWPRLFEGELTTLLEEFGEDFWTHYRQLYRKPCVRREQAFKRAQREYARTGSVARFLMLADAEIVDLKHSLRQAEVSSEVQNRFLKLAGRLIRFKPAVAQKFLPVLYDAIEREKKRLGAYTYDDMLSLVWHSVSRPSGKWLTQVLRRRYRVALIDEFQDTDELQWKIFRHIFFESPYANKLYLIGDPKQAIYGFRGADVYTYLRACDVLLQADEDEAIEGQKLHLDHNYRSTERLLKAYNSIFDQRAEKPFFRGESIQYTHPVKCGQPDLALRDVNDQIVAPIVLGTMKRKPGQKASVTMDEIYECYGRWIAFEIRKLLTKSGQLHFGKDGEMAPIRAKDIFVLTRSGADERRLEKYLQQAGVPYAVFKHEGLFQTQEAHELYVLLRAIDDPHDRGKRLKAWETPFFGVDMKDLAQCRDLTESEPMFKLLLDWNHMARHQRFESLFTDILQHSGLVRREIFFKDSERELTNYLHLMEVLLEEVYLGRLDMRQLVVRMSAFLEGKRKPIGDDSNVKRLESDRDAVQILTMHKSKGLEASIVFLYPFGGTSGEYWPFHYTNHDGDHVRAMHILKPEGKISPNLRQRVDLCAREEDERLLYVALTRAKARLYLPYVPYVGDSPINKSIATRSYSALNEHLMRMLPAIAQDQYVDEHGQLFECQDIPYFGRHIPVPEQDTDIQILAQWEPPVEYLREHLPQEEALPEPEPYYPPMRSLASYSSIKRKQGGYHVPVALSEEELRLDDELGASEEAIIGQDELPGGVRTGQCLHDILERLDYSTLTKYQDVEQWSDAPEVHELFEQSLIQHGLEFDVLPLCQRVIYRSLNATIEVEHGVIYGLGLCIPNVRELAFYYPIPEEAHPRLDVPPETRWTVEKGFIKGYIDYVFQWQDRLYFVDWKSDVLDRYEGQALQQHFSENYMIQVMLYTTALCKMSGIHDEETYERRFGSAIYCFLRGMADDSHHGLCRHRPSWQELLDFEQMLLYEGLT